MSSTRTFESNYQYNLPPQNNIGGVYFVVSANVYRDIPTTLMHLPYPNITAWITMQPQGGVFSAPK